MALHYFRTLPVAVLLAGLSCTAQAETLTLWADRLNWSLSTITLPSR